MSPGIPGRWKFVIGLGLIIMVSLIPFIYKKFKDHGKAGENGKQRRLRPNALQRWRQPVCKMIQLF